MCVTVSCSRDGFTPDDLYASGVDTMTLVVGAWFTPDGRHDSDGDSTTPVTGKYTANYFTYKKWRWVHVHAERLVQQWSSGTLSCPRGSFIPHGMFDSSWDSVAPTTGNIQQITPVTNITFG